MNRRRFIGASMMVLAVTMAATAQDVPQLPDYYPADYAEIIEASRSESGIVVYGNMSADAWSGALARFSTLYPWIRVETLDLSSTELFERYLAEKGTGGRSADLLVSTAQQNWLNLIARDEVLSYRSPEQDQLPDLAVLADGVYAIAVDPVIMVWNKLLLPEDRVPASLADLAAGVEADPEFWRGRITTYDPTASGTGYQSHYAQIIHHGDAVWELFETIAPMVRGETSNGPMLEKIITGEYLIAYNTLPSNIWFSRDQAALEAIVGWSFVDEGTYLSLRGSAITAGAASPNSAKLLLDVVLSHEGQVGLGNSGITPVRLDVTSEEIDGAYSYASIVEAIPADQLIPVPYTGELLESRDAFIARWDAARE